jgi:hypothetical protein
MNLNDILQSEDYIAWHESMINNMSYDDPERFDRCAVASTQGADGSFHAEVMNDWLHFLEFNSLDMGVTNLDYHKIQVEILECWDWHDKEGSLYDEVG